jgi:hypothetical protein
MSEDLKGQVVEHRRIVQQSQEELIKKQNKIIARKNEIDFQIEELKNEKIALAKMEQELVKTELASRPTSPLGVQKTGM